MSDSASLCFEGDQKDMGSITSFTKTDKQDFLTEGVTRGVEDDVPDDNCILSERECNIEQPSVLDKVCGGSVNVGDNFIRNNKTADVEERRLTKCVVALQDQQCGDYVKDVPPTESVPSATNLIDKDINNKNMAAGNTNLHYDKCRKSFPNEQSILPEAEIDNTVTTCQIKEENHLYPHEASSEEKSKIRADNLNAQSGIISCSVQTDQTVDYSHTSSGNSNKNQVCKRSFIIETLVNILNRKGKQLEINSPMAGAATASVKSQHVDNKRANKDHFHSVPSALSVSPTENLSSNTEARKLQMASVNPDALASGTGRVRKHLKSGVVRVTSQLEKLQQALDKVKFNTDNSLSLTITESLKNQIKGMKTAVTQMYHIAYNTPQKNLSLPNILHEMAMQLSIAEEEILKSYDTTKDPVTYLLHFQGTLDSLKEGH